MYKVKYHNGLMPYVLPQVKFFISPKEAEHFANNMRERNMIVKVEAHKPTEKKS